MATTKQSQSVRIGLRFKPEMLREPYDAVVIGSGPGGLSAAVCLSKQGGKVAVFEQHYTAGGYTRATGCGHGPRSLASTCLGRTPSPEA